MNKIKQLTKKELNELEKVLRAFEEHAYKHFCTGKLCGEFATAEISDYDNDVIEIELKYGIKEDGESTVHTEQCKLNRSDLNKEISIEDKVRCIYD